MKSDYFKLLGSYKAYLGTVMVCVLIVFSSCNEEDEVSGIIPPKPYLADSLSLPDTIVGAPDTVVSDPVVVKKGIKITWSDLDYKQYQYDSNGLLTRYYFQYVFVQNQPDKLKVFDYTFKYDDTGRVIESNYNNVIKAVYEYNGGVLKGAKEYTANNEMRAEMEFSYDNQSRLIAIITKHFYPSVRTSKNTYEYSSDGNLITLKQYNGEGNQYKLSLSFHLDRFDDKHHVENATAFSPYLPQNTFWKNNPGRRIVKTSNGSVAGAIEEYSYQHDAKDNPISKTTKTFDTNITTSLNCTYTYQN